MAMSRSRGGRCVTDRAPMRMSPLVTSSRPAIIRSVVVLPQPEGPTRTRNSWSRTVRSIPATARTSPNRFSTRSRTTSAMRESPQSLVARPGTWDQGLRTRLLDRTKFLLRLFHGGARRLSLADLGEHRGDDEFRIHARCGLGHRAGIADELDPVGAVLFELDLGLVS